MYSLLAAYRNGPQYCHVCKIFTGATENEVFVQLCESIQNLDEKDNVKIYLHRDNDDMTPVLLERYCAVKNVVKLQKKKEDIEKRKYALRLQMEALEKEEKLLDNDFYYMLNPKYRWHTVSKPHKSKYFITPR